MTIVGVQTRCPKTRYVSKIWGFAKMEPQNHPKLVIIKTNWGTHIYIYIYIYNIIYIYILYLYLYIYIYIYIYI